jgi:hypothetical protein
MPGLTYFRLTQPLLPISVPFKAKKRMGFWSPLPSEHPPPRLAGSWFPPHRNCPSCLYQAAVLLEKRQLPHTLQANCSIDADRQKYCSMKMLWIYSTTVEHKHKRRLSLIGWDGKGSLPLILPLLFSEVGFCLCKYSSCRWDTELVCCVGEALYMLYIVLLHDQGIWKVIQHSKGN